MCIEFQYIQLGKPKQNACIERINLTVRDERLSQNYWKDNDEVRDFVTEWVWHFNQERHYMALGVLTPKKRLAIATEFNF
jgi:putative transposase